MAKKMTKQEKMEAIMDWIGESHSIWVREFGDINKSLGWEDSPNGRLAEEDKDEFIRVIMDFYEDEIKLDNQQNMFGNYYTRK